MRTCVIIPTYNEAKTIADVIKDVRQQGLEVLVVDDGSKDKTAQLASSGGAIVLRNEKNLGKGASLIRGADYALKQGFEAMVIMDGDGQHLACDLPYFIRLATYSDSAIFIGNRMINPKSMPATRVITNKFMSWLISKITRQDIPDSQCGFRLIKREVFESIKLATKKYETDSEILIKAARQNFKIESVPVKTVYAQEKSQINPLIDTLRFFRFIIRELWTTQP